MEKANVAKKKISNIKNPHHSLVKLWDVYILLSIPVMTEHYLALCFYLLTRSLQTKISWNWGVRHTIKLSYRPQVPFTVSGDTVVKIQHVIPLIECWGLILDRIIDPHVYESSCESNDTNGYRKPLPLPEWKWTRFWGHTFWHSTIIEKEGCMPLGCTGRLLSDGVTERTGLWPKQHHRFVLFSAVLYIRNSPKIWAAQNCVSAGFTPFLAWSQHFTLQLRIWSLFREKASAYMEDNVDLQWACW